MASTHIVLWKKHCSIPTNARCQRQHHAGYLCQDAIDIAGLPFDKLGQCSFRIKKNIIMQIKQIIDETLDIPEEQRRLEQY
jgi:hypothetical protein